MSGRINPAKKEHEDCDHNDDCGHTAVKHGDGVAYVQEGKLYRKDQDGSWQKCKIEDTVQHPSVCVDDSASGCWAHAAEEICGPDCGHEAIEHDDHMDYLVPDGKGEFELHCPHDDHCDHHGSFKQHVPPPFSP
jgi:hypothetical protein